MRTWDDENGNTGVCFSVSYNQVELWVFMLVDEASGELGSRGYISHDGDGICGWFGPGERFSRLEEAVVTMGEAITQSLCIS